jgi:hypothetical protein
MEEQARSPALLTVATVGLVLVHDADAVMFVGPIPEPAIVAWNWEVCPSAVRVVSPVRDKLIWEQVTGAEPVVVPDEAVRFAVPGARQVSSPPDETVATAGDADCQLAEGVTSF